MGFNKAKQMLLNEARKLRTKAEGRERDAIKYRAEANELEEQAKKLS